MVEEGLYSEHALLVKGKPQRRARNIYRPLG
jgi:hypothetical protein